MLFVNVLFICFIDGEHAVEATSRFTKYEPAPDSGIAIVDSYILFALEDSITL